MPKHLVVLLFTIFGISCGIYGIAVFSVGSGTSFFVVWFALCIGALALGWLISHGTWFHFVPWLRHLIVAVLGIGLVWIVIQSALILSYAATPPTDTADTLIVLGAQVKRDKTPSSVLQYRLDAAISYLEQHPKTNCIVSGGQGSNEPISEAACMRQYLLSHGIEADRIVVEDKAESTLENLRFSRKLIAPHATVAIVTNDFHLRRALRIAEREGFNHPEGLSAWSDPAFLPNNLLRECLATTWDTIHQLLLTYNSWTYLIFEAYAFGQVYSGERIFPI